MRFLKKNDLKHFDLVAQLVEHLPFKERVLGSSPSQVTRESKTHHTVGFLFGEKPSLLEIFDSIKNSNRRLRGFYFLTLGALGPTSERSE